MLRSMRHAALGFGAMLLAARLAAGTTPAPPDWQDGQGPSVYLAANPHAAANGNIGGDRYSVANQSADVPPPVTAPPIFDAAVTSASHSAPATENEFARRRLAPPSNLGDRSASENRHARAGGRRTMDFGLPVQPIYTVGAALAIVIGAFLVFAWVLKKGNKHTRGGRGWLPAEAVNVLGRVPITPRQFAELLRIGNKLVLVAMTPSGPTTLTEITDAAEVDRLVGLCQQFDPHSTTKAFEQVFQQFSNEPTSGTFLGGEPLPTSLSPAARAYHSQRGAARV
jgi:flagellar biogenesis protein FliO